jgi:uncharacterized iron-regulated membrane protein
MNLWERWLRRPKSIWLRKALFQIHLWTGIALGLYVLVISLTGSAIVFRDDLYNVLWPGPRTVAISGPRLTHDQLGDAARRAYPKYKLSWIWDRQPNQAPNRAVEVWLDRSGHRKERLFDPYTGRDLGESRPYSIQFLAWLADLHVNLLSGRLGRLVNGIGAAFIVLLSLTGAIVWWPGVATWRRSVIMQESSNWKLFNWELHSVVGLWTLPVIFVFGLVGFYASFPKPIQVLVNKVAPLRVNRLEPSAQLPAPTKFVPLNPSAPGPPRFVRLQPSTGDQIIRWFSYLHFGNFGGWISKTIWVFLGLAPAFLFITGVLMWFNRVIAPAARRALRRRAQPLRTTGI